MVFAGVGFLVFGGFVHAGVCFRCWRAVVLVDVRACLIRWLGLGVV